MATLHGIVRFLACGVLGLVGYISAHVAAWLGAEMLTIDGRLPVFIWVMIWFLAPVVLVVLMCAAAVWLKCANHLLALGITVVTGLYALALTVDIMKSDTMVGPDGQLYIREAWALSNRSAHDPGRWEFVQGYFDCPELMIGVGVLGYVLLPLVGGGMVFMASSESARDTPNNTMSGTSPVQDSLPTKRYPELRWPD